MNGWLEMWAMANLVSAVIAIIALIVFLLVVFVKANKKSCRGNFTPPKPSYTIPMPPQSAAYRYARLITAVELIADKLLTEEQKKMLITLAESGCVKK